VRPATAAEAAFVAGAGARSAEVRDLAAKLDQTDVVAYVHLARVEPGQPESALRFAARSVRQRFVVITIGSSLPADRQIALLGHELQHVAEVAHVSWVSNQSDLRSLMALIGWHDPSRAVGYETSAAVCVERRINRALAVVTPKP
jgi:hypothetical protein